MSKVVVIDYTNYRGERRERQIVPRYIWFGVVPWHTGHQWLLAATDIKKNELRDFAMKDIHEWRPV